MTGVWIMGVIVGFGLASIIRRGAKMWRMLPPAADQSDAHKSVAILRETGCMVLDAPPFFYALSEKQMVEYADRYWYEGRA